MIQPSGNIFYQDEYGTQYQSVWRTVGTAIDITTITRIPYVWGQAPEGYYQRTALFRKGIITTHRQVLEIYDDGYAIIAEGTSQEVDFFQTTFPCGSGPTDPFAHHLDCAVSDEIEMRTTEGPHWADPDDEDDMDAIWAVLDINGDVVPGTSTEDPLEWIDVWE